MASKKSFTLQCFHWPAYYIILFIVFCSCRPVPMLQLLPVLQLSVVSKSPRCWLTLAAHWLRWVVVKSCAQTPPSHEEKRLVALLFMSQQQILHVWDIPLTSHSTLCFSTDCQKQSQVNTWVTEAGKVCSFLEAFTVCSLMVLMCSTPLPSSSQKWSGEWSSCQEN